MVTIWHIFGIYRAKRLIFMRNKCLHKLINHFVWKGLQWKVSFFFKETTRQYVTFFGHNPPPLQIRLVGHQYNGLFADHFLPDELDVLHGLFERLFVVHRVHHKDGVHIGQVFNGLQKRFYYIIRKLITIIFILLLWYKKCHVLLYINFIYFSVKKSQFTCHI